MATTWTTEQILALAPDASSAKSGRELATPRKWVTLGNDESCAWGECQGSGAKPYQASIDLSEPAFRCTCPSRKFPCKHALGLFLLLADQPAGFTVGPPPGWVSEWLASRAQRAEKRSQKEEKAEAVPDTRAQARRAVQRETKVAAGLAELDLWLRDLARRGLAAAQGQPFGFWEGPAARMVDAQAPGVARMVREMAGVPASGDGWQERLLERLGQLHLLREGYQRLDTLPPPTQADIRARIGWTQSQEELMAQPGVIDHWRVLGQRVEIEDRLRVQRTWLWGRDAGKPALLLQFAPVSQAVEGGIPPGIGIDAELVYYPGAVPVRAVIKEHLGQPAPLSALPGWSSIAAAVEAYAAALAADPWLELFPLPLQAVVPIRVGDGWAVRDAEAHLLPLSPRFEWAWELLAMSGGHPLILFGEWDGDTLLPLSACAEGRFCPLARAPG